MNDRALMRTGVVGAVVAAICCFTPTLALLLSAVGLSAWLAWLDFVVLPVLVLSLGLIGWALIRRHRRKQV